MAGLPGRSGRRAAKFSTDPNMRQRVIDKSWRIAEEFLNNADVTLAAKAEFAKAIIVKNIPQELEHTGDLKINYGHRSKFIDSSIRPEQK